MNEDEIKGVARDAVGKVKDAAGGLTGDAGLQAEGKIDQAGGKFRANTAQPRISLATQSMLSPIRRRTLPTGRARRWVGRPNRAERTVRYENTDRIPTVLS